MFKSKLMDCGWKLFVCICLTVFSDTSTSGDAKSRVTDNSHSPCYRIRAESEQVSLFSPEQSSLHESEGLLFAIFPSSAAYIISFASALSCGIDGNFQPLTTSLLLLMTPERKPVSLFVFFKLRTSKSFECVLPLFRKICWKQDCCSFIELYLSVKNIYTQIRSWQFCHRATLWHCPKSI